MENNNNNNKYNINTVTSATTKIEISLLIGTG